MALGSEKCISGRIAANWSAAREGQIRLVRGLKPCQMKTSNARVISLEKRLNSEDMVVPGFRLFITNNYSP